MMEHQGVCLVRRGGAQQMEAELARAGDRWKMRNNVNIKPDIVFSSQGISIAVVITTLSSSLTQTLERVASLASFRYGIVLMDNTHVEVVQEVIRLAGKAVCVQVPPNTTPVQQALHYAAVHTQQYVGSTLADLAQQTRLDSLEACYS